MAGRETHYEVLEVDFGASDRTIQRAYRQQAQEHHPDHHPPEERDRARKRFERIQEAYRVLTDDRKRALYDRELLRKGQAGIRNEEFWDHWRRELNEDTLARGASTMERQVMDSFEADWLEERYGGETADRERFRRHFNYGKLHFAQGNLDRAEEEFRTAHELCKNNILSTYYVGRCHERRGKFEQAVTHYEEAVEIGASRPEPYLNKCLELRDHLIDLLEEIGRRNQASDHRERRRSIRHRTGLSNWMGDEDVPEERTSKPIWNWVRRVIPGITS